MVLLEYDFAQIEHINQIIYNNTSFDGWDCFDTYELIEQYGTYGTGKNITKNVHDVRYNSFIININTTDANYYIYTIEVRNSLWDGTYKISHSWNGGSSGDSFGKNDLIISKDDTNTNIIKISVKKSISSYKDIRVCFHMSMAGDGRYIETTSLQLKLDNENEYTHQYDETVYETGHVYDELNELVDGVNVSIVPCDVTGKEINTGIPSHTITNIKDGVFKMPYGPVDTPGDYYVLMTVDGNNAIYPKKVSQVIHVRKIQNQTIKIDWTNSNIGTVHKGSVHIFKIPLQVLDEFGNHDIDLDYKLEGLLVNVSSIRATGTRITESCHIEKLSDNSYIIKSVVSYREYYEDYSSLEVEIPVTSGFGYIVEQHKINHTWFIASDFNDLVEEVNDTNYGADWIFLKPTTYTATSTIEITRPITIAGLIGSNRCCIDGEEKYNIIKINNSSAASDNYMKVNLVGICFTHGQRAIYMATGCRLLIDSCLFTENYDVEYHHKGCSIFMPFDDNHLENNHLWKLEVRNSVFYNNKGNEIYSIGRTYIHNNLFRTTSHKWLQQPEVKVVHVIKGDVLYKYNKSHIKSINPLDTNHSWAKALTFVEKRGKFNGKGSDDVAGYNKLPVFGSPWYNECYTYAIYWYPHMSPPGVLVCFPRYGRERTATGGGGAKRRFMYMQGYDLWRYGSSHRTYNTYDPWTTKELTIPDNQGIYNSSTDKFKEGYDPRLSDNKSMTSNIPSTDK